MSEQLQDGTKRPGASGAAHPGSSTMLLGPVGSGKTFSIPTLVKAGLKLACVFTDPGGQESLLDACKHYDVDMSDVHYTYVAPASPGWRALQRAAGEVNKRGYEELTKMKYGIEKSEYQQFTDLLHVLANFKCDHCGMELGPVDGLDESWAVVVDGLSGINTMAMDMTIGAKPAAHQGEWGVAMNMEERLLMKLTSDLRAFFVLIAHVEREVNETAGTTQLMAGALGRKLAPKLPRTFSDVVLARREGDKFFWSTTATGVDLKTRSLPLSDKLLPSFEAIVDKWRERNGAWDEQLSSESESGNRPTPTSSEPKRKETTQ